MNKYKKFIKEMGSNLDSTVSGLFITEKFPELFETKLEVGKWYKSSYCDEIRIAYCARIENRRLFGYGMGSKGWVYESISGWGKQLGWHPATDKEVEEMLAMQSENMFGDNVVKSVETPTTATLNYNKTSYSHNDNQLYIKVAKGITEWCCVFSNGKWATIIEQPLELTVEEISEKYGREVKIVK